MVKHIKPGAVFRALPGFAVFPVPFPVPVFVIVVFCLVFSQSAGAQYTQVDQLKRQVSQMRGELQYLAGEMGKVRGAAGNGSAYSGTGMELRVSALEVQLRALTGEAERLNYRLTQNNARLEAFISGLDQRFAALESTGLAEQKRTAQLAQDLATQKTVLRKALLRLGGNTNADGLSTGSDHDLPVSENPRNGGVGVEVSGFPVNFEDDADLRAFMDGSQSSALTASGSTLSGGAFDPYEVLSVSVPVDSGQAFDSEQALAELPAALSADGKRVSGQPDTGQPAGTAGHVYQRALAAFKAGQISEARKGFEAFLNGHKEDPLAGNASYWLGETHYSAGDYTRAALQFSRGFSSYKTSAKAPDHLLKLALSLEKLGRFEEACTAIKLLQRSHLRGRAELALKSDGEKRRLACGPG